PKSAGLVARIRGIVIVVAAIIVILLAGFGIVSLVSLATGGLSLDLRIFWGVILVLLAVVVLTLFGRRRQKRAQAKRAEQLAARSR
ncbi:MAG: hypothetical protein ACRDMX_17955, partial [Solirubrobacteraceae bacterium]